MKRRPSSALHEWDVLIYPTLRCLLDSRNNVRFYIGQKASDKPGKGNIFQA